MPQTAPLGLPEAVSLTHAPLGSVNALLALFDEAQTELFLEQLASMEPNWDGYGALPIDRATFWNSLSALRRLRSMVPSPEIVPNPNGTISFEWSTEIGEAHIEIGRTRFAFLAKPTGGDAVLVDGAAGELTEQLGALIAAVVYPSKKTVASLTTSAAHAWHPFR